MRILLSLSILVICLLRQGLFGENGHNHKIEKRQGKTF